MLGLKKDKRLKGTVCVVLGTNVCVCVSEQKSWVHGLNLASATLRFCHNDIGAFPGRDVLTSDAIKQSFSHPTWSK